MRVVRTRGRLRRGLRRRAARGAVVVRRRHDAGREVRRVRPPHRGAGHGRHPRHGAAPLRARLLDPAPPPEGAGGGARARRSRRGPARGDHVVGRRAGRAVRLHQRRHRRVPARQRHRRVLLPRDEHPPPGRAPGHRGGHAGPTASASTSSSSSSASPTGEPLAIAQDDVTLEGHAIEARVYAEDSFNGFLPQAGRTSIVRWASGDGVRVDHALEPEQEVSTSYDPMLGKVIAQGADRETRPPRAGRRPRRHRDPRAHHQHRLPARAGRRRDEFRDATIDTAWLDRNEVPAPDAGPGARLRGLDRGAARHHAAGDSPARGRPTAGGWAPTRPRTRWSSSATTWSWSTGTAGRSPTPAPRTTYAWSPPPTTPSTSLVDGRPSTRCVNVQRGVVDVVHRGQRCVVERPDPFGDHARGAGDGTLARADARHRPRRQRRRGPGRRRG